MSQEDNQELAVYYAAVESFESLESLFLSDNVDPTHILPGFHSCYQKVDTIILKEDLNSSYSVDLFQMKHHILELREMIENKIKRQQVLKDQSASKLQFKSMISEKQLNFVKSTIETPRSNGFMDIGGLWDVKKILKSFVILPRNQPQLFVNRKACNSILLFGPPGTGKTRLVHALAYEANAILYSVSTSDMLSPLVGQTEKNVQALFDYIGNSQIFSILFIDEIDGFCRKRTASEQDHTRRLKTELMCQMSKLEDNRDMFLICATNCPWDLDSAFLRRFQKQLYIPLPNSTERHELFQMFLSNSQLDSTSAYWEQLINKSEGFSGSDISNLVTCALNVPVVELEDTKIWKLTTEGFYEPVISSDDCNIDFEHIMCCEINDLPFNSVRTRPVHMVDIVNALESINPTISGSEITKYEAFINKQ